MQKCIKIMAIIAIFMCILNISSPILAKENDIAIKADKSILDTIFGQGGKWFKDNYNAKDENGSLNIVEGKKLVITLFKNGGFIDLIKTVGYLIFFIAGAVLGIKYMLSGYEGKAFVKDGLVSYTIGIVFFFLAEKLVRFIGNILLKDISYSNNFNTLEGNIWGNFQFIISILMVAIVVFYGLKYMWSSADQKSDLKKGMIPMVIGAVLIVCTLQIITFIVNVSNDVLPNYTETFTGNNIYIEYCLQQEDLYNS